MSACSLTGNVSQRVWDIYHENLAARLTVLKKLEGLLFPVSQTPGPAGGSAAVVPVWGVPPYGAFLTLRKWLRSGALLLFLEDLRNPCPAYFYSFVSFRLHSAVPQGEHSTLRPPNRAQARVPGYFTSARYEVSPSVYSIWLFPFTVMSWQTVRIAKE